MGGQACCNSAFFRRFDKIPGHGKKAAGNQTRIVKPDGSALRFQYDAAGRLVKVKNDSQQTITTYTYGVGRERLVTQDGNESSTALTYYLAEGGAVIAEYAEGAGQALVWQKNYIYMGGALLAIQQANGTSETVQFAHPDQLGTRIMTNPATGTYFEQTTLPFGTAESSGGINQRFTSYDRSTTTGLDYANNRYYDSAQGRFTTVDPIQMDAASLLNPQTLNLYAYTTNDPINRTDPSGLDHNQFHVNVYGAPWPTGGTGSSTLTGLGQFLTGVLGNLFGGHSYAGTFGHPTYFWQLNTARITPSAPPPLPGAGTTHEVRADNTYVNDDCINEARKINTNSDSDHQYTRNNAITAIIMAAGAADFSIPQAAYALATAEVETTYYTSSGLRESAPNGVDPVKYFNKKYNGILGNVKGSNDGYDYRGGGFTQLTGRVNYQKFGYEDSPGDVANGPTAAKILITGLSMGFTKFGNLADFVGGGKKDYPGARKVVNAAGLKAGEVAGFAKKYEGALNKCKKIGHGL